MLDEKEIETLGFANERIFYELEDGIIEDIVRRIKKTGQITSSADYQLTRLVDMGFDMDDVKERIQKALGKSDKYINQLFKDVLEQEYVRDKAIYEAKGIPFVPFEENEYMKQFVLGIERQTGEVMRNMTQTLGFVIVENGKTQGLALSEYYRHVMDKAVLEIASGSFDYNTAIKRAIKEMTKSGVRWINYDSGWHNRITVASRRAVMTGVSQIVKEISDYNAEKLDAEYFEVSAHDGARPSHAIWQGKVYTKEELTSICGLGDVQGLMGANCMHTYYPFFKGISERAYTDEELKQWQEEKSRTWEGKAISRYDASQIMRKKETSMRAQRELITNLKRAGASKDTINEEYSKYRIMSAEYTKIAKHFDLKQQRERIYLDGLGRITKT